MFANSIDPTYEFVFFGFDLNGLAAKRCVPFSFCPIQFVSTLHPSHDCAHLLWTNPNKTYQIYTIYLTSLFHSCLLFHALYS